MVRRRRSILRSTHPFRVVAFLSFIAFLAVVFDAASVFGPRIYTRGNGKPVKVTSTFQVPHPSNPYTLRVVNHGVTNAEISLNGHVVLDEDDFTKKKNKDKDDDKKDNHDAKDDKDKNDKDKDEDKDIKTTTTTPTTIPYR